MRTELKAKFIQHLNRKQSEKGFTLVELLVVIIIIGILAAIALPNFLNQTSKAKQSEGKQNIALVNKTQNSYRAENSTFATAFDILAIGSVTGGASGTTTNYMYGITAATGTDSGIVSAIAKDAGLKGYTGGAVRFANGSNMNVIKTVMCEAVAAGTATPAAVAPVVNTPPVCTAGTTILSL